MSTVVAAVLATAVIAGCAVCASAAVFRLLMVAGESLRWGTGKEGSTNPDPGPDDLPSYTVLVPLFHEAGMVAPLTTSLSLLDYPADRLQVLLLCEADDAGTIEAIRARQLAAPFELIICPPGEPRTKPRACNVGLEQATGDLCVIYDAEDRPHPDQLRVAARTFAAGAADVDCLQAVLDFYNADQNWLARCFSVDYLLLFRFILPWLGRRNLPIPLGGTSNHFRTDRLRAYGGWDADNVTEDAELGIRIHRAGRRTTMLDSVTMEEACALPTAWIRQRTRWMRGYMQTWYAYGPRVRTWSTGLRPAVAFHLLVGGTPIAALLAPLLIFVGTLCALSWWPGSPTLTAVLSWVALACGTAPYAAMVPAGLIGSATAKRWRLVPAAFLMAGYWLLVSVASWRAALQLLAGRHHWEKTPHGLTGHETDPGRTGYLTGTVQAVGDASAVAGRRKDQ